MEGTQVRVGGGGYTGEGRGWGRGAHLQYVQHQSFTPMQRPNNVFFYL